MSGYQHREVPVPGSHPVLLYLADLDGIFHDSGEAVQAQISPAERKRAGRFHRKLDRTRFMASRFLLRKVLGEITGRSPESIDFEFNAFGKPGLPGAPISFNLSHSEGNFALAVSRCRCVGIDVETRITSETAEEVAPGILSSREFSEWKTVPRQSRAWVFARYWILKEAILKAYGEGLSQDPRGIELLIKKEELEIMQLPDAFGPIHDWRLLEIDNTGDFPCVALAMII